MENEERRVMVRGNDRDFVMLQITLSEWRNMKQMIDSKLFNWILVLTIVGEFFLPWILKHFYIGYDAKKMVMSALGNPESPVRKMYNIWLIWIGLFLIFTSIIYFINAKEVSLVLAILQLVSILTFAIGAGILSGLFSVNESKDVVTMASKIHGAGAAIGFMTLLFFPLLSAVLAFKMRDVTFGVVCVVAFVLAIVFFAFFIMGDKKEFKETIFVYEGLWERATLLCMYIPFVYSGMYRILN